MSRPPQPLTAKKQEQLAKVIELLSSKREIGLRGIAKRVRTTQEGVRALIATAQRDGELKVQGNPITLEMTRKHGSAYMALRAALGKTNGRLTPYQTRLLRLCAGPGDISVLAQRLHVLPASMEANIYTLSKRLGFKGHRKGSFAVANAQRFFLACVAVVKEISPTIHADAYPQLPLLPQAYVEAIVEGVTRSSRSTARSSVVYLPEDRQTPDVLRSSYHTIVRTTAALCRALKVRTPGGMKGYQKGHNWEALGKFLVAARPAELTPAAYARAVYRHISTRKVIDDNLNTLSQMAAEQNNDGRTLELLGELTKPPFESTRAWQMLFSQYIPQTIRRRRRQTQSMAMAG